MIPTEKNELELTSTLEGEDIQMTVDEEALDYIMVALTNIYEDAELAVIREYSTNARDSHIAAGVLDPIEVTLPTMYSPVMKITDHGVGLNRDDIKHIYSRYGRSTKRTSNEFTGYIGIGCKAALAYTSQFTVNAVKDGERIAVIVSRDEENRGHMHVVSRAPTEDPNGVEITVPMSPSSHIEPKVLAFFKYWPAGSVLVNGKPVDVVTGIKVTSTITLVRGSNEENKLLMGDVTYRVRQNELDVPYGWRIVARVPMGSVHLTPSREGLDYSDKTKVVLKEVRECFKANVKSAIQRELAVQRSHWDAFIALEELRSAIPRRMQFEPTYRNEPIPTKIAARDDTKFITSRGEELRDWYDDTKRREVGKHFAEKHVAPYHVQDAVWVHGFSGTFTHVTKRKLWLYLERLGWKKPKYFILVDQLPSEKWIKPKRVVFWPNAQRLKLPKPARTGASTPRRKETYYPVVEETGHQHEMALTEIEKKNAPVFFLITTNTYSAYSAAEELRGLLDKFTLIFIPHTRRDKLERVLPQALDPWTFLKEAFAPWWESLSAGERAVIQVTQGSGYAALKNLPQFGIEDPELRLAIRAAKGLGRAKVAQLQLAVRAFKDAGKKIPPGPDFLERYPILSCHKAKGRAAAIYVNALYEERCLRNSK